MSLQAVTFGGINLSQYLTGITIDRSLLPDVELSRVEIPASDGDVVAGRRLKAMEIRLNATLKGQIADVVNANRRSLAEALNKDGAAALVLPDETGITYDAWVKDSTTLDRGYSNPHVTIVFHVPSATGRGTAKTISVGTSNTTVTRGGNAASWPMVTAYPSGSTWRITNVTTGQYVEAVGSFSGGKLVIDMQNETVTYGGSACSFALASDFFALDAASQSLKATSAATLAWDERWV